MLLRSPAEFYLKYLIVHPDGYTDEQIQQICEQTGLDHLGKKNLEMLRIRCVPKQPFRPSDTAHIKSQKFLIQEGIRQLYHPDKDTKIAFKILGSPRAKEYVEAMILSHAPALELAASVQRYRGLFCTEGAIHQYKLFFWNIDLLDATQMRTLMHMRVELTGGEGEGATKEDKVALQAARRASYMDPRKLAADLPHSPVTALMAQMRMGAMPGKGELAKAVELVQAIAVMRAAEATLYGSLKDSMAAKNFSDVARNMTEMLESIVKPDENLREQLNAIALRTNQSPIPSIHQLSAGHHTVEVQPINQDNNDFSGTPSTGGSRNPSAAKSP